MSPKYKKLITRKDDPVDASTAGASPAHNSKLVELFENRNLIKRELDQITAERDSLKNEAKDLRASNEELLRQLNNLEQMLADAERGQSAIVYYRLRAVWNTCRQQLLALAEDLGGRFEKAERGGFEEKVDKDRGRRLDVLTEQFDKLERERRNLRNNLGDLQKQLPNLQKFWHKNKRAEIQIQIEKLTKQFKPIESKKLELLAAMEEMRREKQQAWPGIKTASKRTVNLWLLGLAQYLYLHFREYNIAEMARSAGTKPVSDVNFGLLNDCLIIGNHIYEVVVKLRGDKTRPEKLRFRVEHLRRGATYASDSDTVPDEACLDYISLASQTAPTIDAEAQPVGVNILRMNYWDIQGILLMPPAPAKSQGSQDQQAAD
ncbi:MAG: hypothetical protein KGL13_02210 [Gammaproteobacteria bacterium]|nr:hypothetical protein [Gammaproteobacteria bacterium]MDE2345260.1 hypothetical protein [Gammaproteobacteria bacterium]